MAGPYLLRAGVVLAILTGIPAAIRAHDMWIEPASFFPQAGQVIGIRLRVGQDLLGDPIPRDPSHLNQFIVEDAAGRRPVGGRVGADPAGFLKLATPGVVVIGYQSNASTTELPAEQFNQYLKEEGLDSVMALRASRKENGAKGRELFSRCAKSLVFSGTPVGATADRTLGFTLELVAERNPYSMAKSEDLPVRLTFQNRPLAGALVVAISRSNPLDKLTARTGNDGRVHLRLRQGGMWLVKAVHMVPAPAGAAADWESFWASLTFQLRTSDAPAD